MRSWLALSPLIQPPPWKYTIAGGSAAAEINALRRVFGAAASSIVISNTKGFTGHAIGAGVEDVVAVKALGTGLVPALPVQTVLTTLLHLGHPGPEIRAAAGAGLAFGLLAYFTGSFVYPLIIHSVSGISLDIFSFVRERRTS